MIWYLEKHGFTTQTPWMTGRKESWRLKETKDHSRPVWSPWTYPLWTVGGKTVQPNAKERGCAFAMLSFLMKPSLRVAWMALNHLNAWSWKLSKTVLKSFLQNRLRHSLLNVFWITTLMCCLGQSPSLEPLTHTLSLRPRRLRKSCTSFSPKITFARVRPHGLLLFFLPPSDGQLQFCVDNRALNKQTVRNYVPIPHTDVLIDKTQGSWIFFFLIWSFWIPKQSSQDCICYPIWSFWIPRRSHHSDESSLDIPDADELTPGTLTLRLFLPRWHTDLHQERRKTLWSPSTSAYNLERQQVACKASKMQVLPEIRWVIGTCHLLRQRSTLPRQAHCCQEQSNP